MGILIMRKFAGIVAWLTFVLTVWQQRAHNRILSSEGNPNQEDIS